MIELIHKQNKYLHKVHAISVINLGNLQGIFNRELSVGMKRK